MLELLRFVDLKLKTQFLNFMLKYIKRNSTKLVLIFKYHEIPRNRLVGPWKKKIDETPRTARGLVSSYFMRAEPSQVCKSEFRGVSSRNFVARTPQVLSDTEQRRLSKLKYGLDEHRRYRSWRAFIASSTKQHGHSRNRGLF